MSPGVPDSLTTGLRWLQPPPRVVDWSLFVAVIFEASSGILSFLGHSPEWAPLFWAHRIVGLVLVPLIGFKLARVRHRVLDSSQWQPTTLLSVLTALLAASAVVTGVLWVFGIEPNVGPVTMLTLHAGLGLVLVGVMTLHARTRFRPPRRVDFDSRRTTMRVSVLLVGGALTYRSQELVNTALGTRGEDRRLTGSHRREGSGNASFPVVSWVADDPEVVDTEEWRLSVRGRVSDPLELTYDQVQPDASTEAVLDCTGGWYTVQDWEGVRVGDLLARAGESEDARHVRFVSVTGYRWSLPIDEAREALLATHVGGEELTHGHGAPLRLVAPGRRGFQWVKWVERVEVRRRGDSAQWIATLVSGFDES